MASQNGAAIQLYNSGVEELASKVRLCSRSSLQWAGSGLGDRRQMNVVLGLIEECCRAGLSAIAAIP